MWRFPLAVWVFVIGILVSMGQILLLGPLLPDRVASHFGADGSADGFQSREAFLAVHWAMIGFTSALIFGLPMLLRNTPYEMINLPNKEYWLSEEQRPRSLAYLNDRFFSFGSATLALFAGIMQLVYEANIRGAVTIGNETWIYLALYLSYTAIWSVSLARRFAAPR